MFWFLALFDLFYSLDKQIVPPSNHILPVPLVRTGVTSKGSVVGFKVLVKTACKIFFLSFLKCFLFGMANVLRLQNKLTKPWTCCIMHACVCRKICLFCL